MVRRVKAEAEARAREEHDRKLREEAQRIVDENLVRVAKRDRWLEEKLTVVLEGRLSQDALEVDSEVEDMGEAEESEAVGMEEVWMTGGTQSSAMEVDKEEEDEVVVVCLGHNKDLCSRRSKYKSYGALRGCNLGVRDCLQVYCGK